MDREQLRDEILFKVTGGVLSCELTPSAIDKVIDMGIREIQRYYDITTLVTIPYSRCIDVSSLDVSSISRIYRSEGYMVPQGSHSSTMDPMLAAQWQLISGTGSLANFNDYSYNYGAWNTLLQIKNTTSTDLAFRFDKQANKLYINISSSVPNKITLEYVKKLRDVTEITSDYWIDNLTKLCVAITKVTLGRIRSRYTSSNSLWAGDGQQLLEEGTTELVELRAFLSANTNLGYPID